MKTVYIALLLSTLILFSLQGKMKLKTRLKTKVKVGTKTKTGVTYIHKY